MTVKELIKQLQKEDPERVIVLQRDPEGNGYSPMKDFWTGAYVEKYGEVGLEPQDLDEEAKKKGYTKDDVKENGKKALIIYPKY